jgi:hypothetical protein
LNAITTRHRFLSSGIDALCFFQIFKDRNSDLTKGQTEIRVTDFRLTFAQKVVEVNGIEPMTSCLQSRRSPN